MSSDEADKKSVDEDTKDVSSGEETEKDVKEEKNSKPSPKKKGADPPKIKQPAKKRVKNEQAEKETKKEDKKEDKKKEEDDEDEDDESAEESDAENNTAVPLLDQPLEISGSRRRKEVQRFSFKETDGEQKEVKIPEGKGKPLGEIEWIEHNITRARPEDLKLLHRICFGKPAKAALVKKNLKKFNGFDFEEASDDYEKKKVQYTTNKKVTLKNLKSVCHMLGVEQKGTKDEIIERILSFLTCPKDSDKKVGSGRSQRKGASKKNYDEGADEADKPKKKSKAKKKSEESEESEQEKSDEDGEDDEEKDDVKANNKEKNDEGSDGEKNGKEEEEDEEEEEEEKPKKGAKNKKTKKAAEAVEKKAPPKKRAAAKKAAEKKVESEEDGEAEEDEDEEPLAKKSKTPPTDEEIKAYVKSLLEGANLELVTMKKVCQDVYAHYPDHDLGHKKAFIKTTVKSLISS